jgi:hypothetical protein
MNTALKSKTSTKLAAKMSMAIGGRPPCKARPRSRQR